MYGSYTIMGSGWSMYPDGWLTGVGLFAAAVGVLIWFIAVSILVVREGSVDKPNRVPHLYGYTVCLITLLIALFSLGSLIDSAFERANPLQGAGRPFGVSLTSFEAYKTQRSNYPSYPREGDTRPDTASEATLRARYDALVADRIASVRYETAKDFVTKGILLVLSLTLFRFHWTWVRRLSDGGPTSG